MLHIFAFRTCTNHFKQKNRSFLTLNHKIISNEKVIVHFIRFGFGFMRTT